MRNGASREIIHSGAVDLVSPPYVVEEVEKHIDYAVRKSGLGKDELGVIFATIMKHIEVILEEKIKLKMEEASALMEDIDINDSPIVACALAVPNDGIWTEDKDFLRQNRVRVWTTAELVAHTKIKIRPKLFGF